DTDGLGRRLGGPARREEPQRAAAGGLDELGDLVELGVRDALASWRGQVFGDVEHGLLAVVERRADIDAVVLAVGEPERVRDGGEAATQRERGAGENDSVFAEELVAQIAGNVD